MMANCWRESGEEASPLRTRKFLALMMAEGGPGAIMPRLMETISSKPALIATNRLRQTLAALARILDQTMNDVSVVDSEFQARIEQAAQEQEATLRRRTADRLKFAVEEAEQNARVQVTEELQGRFTQEIAAAVESVRNEMNTERMQLKQEVQRMTEAAAEWAVERAQLMDDAQRASQLFEQSRDEHNRALAETDEAAAIALERQIATTVDRVRAELTARWNAERAQLVVERDRATQSMAERESQHQRALAEVQRVAANNLDNKMAKALEQWETERAELIAEIQRAQHQLSETTSNYQRQ